MNSSDTSLPCNRASGCAKGTVLLPGALRLQVTNLSRGDVGEDGEENEQLRIRSICFVDIAVLDNVVQSRQF